MYFKKKLLKLYRQILKLACRNTHILSTAFGSKAYLISCCTRHRGVGDDGILTENAIAETIDARPGYKSRLVGESLTNKNTSATVTI